MINYYSINTILELKGIVYFTDLNTNQLCHEKAKLLPIQHLTPINAKTTAHPVKKVLLVHKHA